MHVIPLDDEKAVSIHLTGGKAAALSRLRGLPLPFSPGFCVATSAYQAHIEALSKPAGDQIQDLLHRNPKSLDATTLTRIRKIIIEAQPPEAVVKDVSSWLDLLRKQARFQPVRFAIRSSATVEDLPHLSFAGQHDSFLNVVSVKDAIVAMKRCWGSLWSERAFYYRRKGECRISDVSMAVLIQEMVPAEASGTLFTANPVTCDKSEYIIEACWGLGELLVRGQVTPDTYCVRYRGETLEVEKRVIKTKKKMLVANHSLSGVLDEVQLGAPKSTSPVLNDEELLLLASFGQRTTEFLGFPVDIEWAKAGTQFVILQARPITTLKSISSAEFSNKHVC